MAWQLDPIPADNNTSREKWYVSTDPTDDVVTWSKAKAHLRLDDDTNQSYVEDLIAAAVDAAQDAMVTILPACTITANFYNNEPIILPRTPLISITSVTDADGNTYTEDDEDFAVVHVGHQCQLVFDTVAAYPITVVYRAGYPDVTKIKANIRLAILQHVATLYENRESISDKVKVPVPQTLSEFYAKNRRAVGVG